MGQHGPERLSRGKTAITNSITLLSNDSRHALELTKRAKSPTIARTSWQATFANKPLFLDVTYNKEDIYGKSMKCYHSPFEIWYPWSHFIRRYVSDEDLSSRPKGVL
jgi:hypothetical protein